jgi:para-nitrobenzyl esterase
MTGVLALSAAALAVSAASDPSLATIDSGVVRGVAANGVISFKGIPYAEPPVGPLRWRMPLPVTPWRGIRFAGEFGPSCMQAGPGSMSEDCLTVNVWRPEKQPAGRLPVMVWIHGGELVRGGASIYPADALAAQGVVVVSMNYRLGRLGFFAHPTLAAEAPHDLRGNYGYMDQLAALAWVRRNIAAFGGDPQAVTLFGESAGGGSVMVHLISPLSRGLFQRAILQSPGIPCARSGAIPLTELPAAEKMAVDYVRALGIMSDGAAGLADLRALPAAKLVEGASAPEVLSAMSAGTAVPGLALAIRDGRLLSEAPEAALAAGHQARVPVMIGANDRDLALGVAGSKEGLFSAFGPYDYEARELYDPQGYLTLDELKQQVFADRLMLEPARHFADETARAGQPSWLYRFSYVPERQRGASDGTLHGHEIPFTFNIPEAIAGDQVTAADQAMGEMASAYFVAFAQTGDPNGGGRPEWPRHNPALDRVINFTNTGVVVGPDPVKARLDLWQKFWDPGGN